MGATFQIVLCQSSNQTVNALRLCVAGLNKKSRIIQAIGQFS